MRANQASSTNWTTVRANQDLLTYTSAVVYRTPRVRSVRLHLHILSATLEAWHRTRGDRPKSVFGLEDSPHTWRSTGLTGHGGGCAFVGVSFVLRAKCPERAVADMQREMTTGDMDSLRQVLQQAFIFVVVANPKPRDRSRGVLYAQCTIGLRDSYAPDVPVWTVQAKRWVPRAFFQQVVLIAGVVLNPPR